jgi:diphthamide biosynthesis protein 2
MHHRTSRLPVIYVFGKQPVDVQDCATVFDGFFAKDKAQKVILMYDVIYAHCIGKDHSRAWIAVRGYAYTE